MRLAVWIWNLSDQRGTTNEFDIILLEGELGVISEIGNWTWLLSQLLQFFKPLH